MTRRLACLGALALVLAGCLTDSTVAVRPAPTELSYNHWLLTRLFIHPDSVPALPWAQAQADSLDSTGAAVPQNIVSLGRNEYFSVMSLYPGVHDRFTRYIAPEKAEQQKQQDTSTQYQGGLGIELVWSVGPDSARIEVLHAYPDCPAFLAGLRDHDRILAINGVDLRNDHADSLFFAVLHANRDLTMLVSRTGQDSLTLSMSKGTVYVPTVFTDTVQGVPVIEVREFIRQSVKDGGTDLEFHRALQATQGLGTRILDLRGNPGGEVAVCLQMADEYVASGKPLIHLISNYFDAHGNARVDTVTYAAAAGGLAEGERVVLAIDSGTASCAEIFTGSLKENLVDNAVLVGTHTYGKGIGQSHWDTPAGGLAIITSLQIRLPLWTDYHHKGIPADIVTDYATTMETALRLAKGDQPIARLAATDDPLRENRILKEPSAVVHSEGAWLTH